MQYNHPTQIPRSKDITSLEWIGPLVSREPEYYMGDSYPIAWAADNELYTSAGDPNFLFIDGKPTSNRVFTKQQEEEGYEKFTGLTVDKITGNGDAFTMSRLNDMTGFIGWGGRGPKPTGMVSVDGVLYLAVQNLLGFKPPRYGCKSQHASDATILRSEDYGKSWSPYLDDMLLEMEREMAVRNASVKDHDGNSHYWVTPPEQRATYKGWTPMFPGHLFGGPTFIQFGKNNEAAVDEYIYAVSADQWDNGTELRLGRVHKGHIQEKDQWEFAVLENGDVSWEKELIYSTPVLSVSGHISAPDMVYLPSVQKYILATWGLHSDFNANDGSELTILEADHPWGPFSLVHYEWMWYKEEAGFYCPKIPLKWFDEKTMTGHLLMSGNWISYDEYYHAHTMQFKFNIKKN